MTLLTKSDQPEQRASVKRAKTTNSPLSRSVAKTDWSFALLGGALLWASYPPLDLWPLAWVALMPWLALVRKEQLGFRRPYRALYFVGLLTWLAMIQWIRLPHWSAYFGWIALSVYLAVYIPFFIGLSRVAVHSLRLPLWFAAPVVWCGLEALRSWLFTGFAMMLLGHTQVHFPFVIQISDIGGPHAVSFVIVLFAALAMESIPRTKGAAIPRDMRWRWALLSAAVLLLAISYGAVRFGQERQANYSAQRTQSKEPDATILLIQGSVDTTFSVEDDPEKTFMWYMRASRVAVANSLSAPPDLIVWPESMFTGSLPYFTMAASFSKPDEVALSDAEFRQRVQDGDAAFRKKTKWVANELDIPLLVGTETVHWGSEGLQRYNSALWIDTTGKITGRYDKMHPVMFGEYVPFGDWLPILYKLTPMPGGLTPGDVPQVVRAGKLNLSPCICFENCVPHLIRRQIRELETDGTAVDGLVTITNDGWFWGSSLLDVHLACGVFRAVENRRLMLIAANTGFSAYIDEMGKVIEKGPRRDTDALIADVHRKPLRSFYSTVGDWLGSASSLFCLLTVVVGWRGHGHPVSADPV